MEIIKTADHVLNLVKELRKAHENDIFQEGSSHAEAFISYIGKDDILPSGIDYDVYMQEALALDTDDVLNSQFNLGYEFCLREIERRMNMIKSDAKLAASCL